MSTLKVALACQGGGSHTAFTAGVLRELVKYHKRDFEIIGFSGTSGGAVCALIGWYGLLHEGKGECRDLLESFWKKNAAREPTERTLNQWVRWASEFRKRGFPTAEISPYQSPLSRWAQGQLEELIEEQVDFSVLPELDQHRQPDLLISAVDVNTGDFKIFKNEEVTTKAILASCAEPNLFEAVEIDGDAYWDGLFSKNPPVQDFSMDNDVRDPDEIWIIQINPQEREDVPTSLPGIMDRRNELAGNQSMNNEVKFLRRINRWIDKGYLPDDYTRTGIRRIRLSQNLSWTTKLERSWSFIKQRMDEGKQSAMEFLNKHPNFDPIPGSSS